MRASFSNTATVALASLIAGEFPRVTRKVTIVSGAGALGAGTVLGRITASKKYLTSLAAAEDGSEEVTAILGEPVDATAADAEAIVYLTGEYRADALTFGAGHTAASTRDDLRALSIFI